LTDDSALSVLTYAVEALGVTEIAVVGHTCCGGAAACLAASTKQDGKAEDAPLSRWLAPLRELAKELKLEETDEKAALRLLVEENVKVQVGFLKISIQDSSLMTRGMIIR
jgi:carbonic anhydrase